MYTRQGLDFFTRFDCMIPSVRLKLSATVFSALKLQKSKVIRGSHHVDELRGKSNK